MKMDKKMLLNDLTDISKRAGLLPALLFFPVVFLIHKISVALTGYSPNHCDGDLEKCANVCDKDCPIFSGI